MGQFRQETYLLLDSQELDQCVVRYLRRKGRDRCERNSREPQCCPCAVLTLQVQALRGTIGVPERGVLVQHLCCGSLFLSTLQVSTLGLLQVRQFGHHFALPQPWSYTRDIEVWSTRDDKRLASRALPTNVT